MTRKEAIENIRKHFDYMQEWITPKEVLKVALEALKQPEIVRCNDCKKYGDNKKCPIEALINSDSKQFFAFDENWFCADGVKKDDSERRVKT